MTSSSILFWIIYSSLRIVKFISDIIPDIIYIISSYQFYVQSMPDKQNVRTVDFFFSWFIFPMFIKQKPIQDTFTCNCIITSGALLVAWWLLNSDYTHHRAPCFYHTPVCFVSDWREKVLPCDTFLLLCQGTSQDSTFVITFVDPLYNQNNVSFEKDWIDISWKLDKMLLSLTIFNRTVAEKVEFI